MKLWLKVLIAMVLGILVGWLVNANGPLHIEGAKGFLKDYVQPWGNTFISLIKMVVIPLIFFSLISGVTSMTDQDAFKRVGLKAVFAFLSTAMFAVIIGLAFGLVFHPGKGVDLQQLAATNSDAAASKTQKFNLMAVTSDAKPGKGQQLFTLDGAKLLPAPATGKDAEKADAKPLDFNLIGVNANDSSPTKAQDFNLNKLLHDIVPENVVGAMSDNDHILQVVLFAIFTAITINVMGEKAKLIREVCQASAQLIFRMISSIMELAPYGVFCIIATLVGSQGLSILIDLGLLMMTVIGALFLQYVLFGVLIVVVGKMSPFPFYRKILEAQSFAFSTSSSKATLPTAMRVLNERIGVSKTNTSFVLPLGASINMDGTAIYLGICSLFFAQAYGIEFQTHQYILLILTATLGSIGAAGIPGGSIFMMGMVFTSVGLPLEGVGVILGIDRVLDMLRTTVNITGDSVITMLIDKSEGTFDKEVYYNREL